MGQYISKQAIQFHIDGLDHRNSKPKRRTLVEIFVDWITGAEEERREAERAKKLTERIHRQFSTYCAK